MSEQAASQPAEVVDVFNGENLGMDEYSRYRATGELPERFKPAEQAGAAPADTSEQTTAEGNEPESAGESETPTDNQEQKPKKPQNAAERIAQIDAQIERLWDQEEPDTIKIAQLEATREKIEQRAGMKRKTESAPVAQQQAQQPKPEEIPPTRPKPEVEAKNGDGTPKYTTYEEYIEDLADWKSEQRQAAWERQQLQREQSRALQSKVDEARSRYEDFDEVIQPTLTEVMGSQQISPVVKAMLNDSEVLPDLLYALGSDAEFAKLAKMPASKQIRYIAAVEAGVAEELSKGSDADRNDKGQFTAPPEKKTTSAPKPPSPVGGASSRAFDVSDESLSADEWMRKRNAQLSRKS